MSYTITEMSMSRFKRYCEEEKPFGKMGYYSVNDRLTEGFPGNRSKYWQYDSPGVEISLEAEYIAFSFNPNRILVGNACGKITFNRVEKIMVYRNGFCGDLAYIFCKNSDTVHCIMFDKY